MSTNSPIDLLIVDNTPATLDTVAEILRNAGFVLEALSAHQDSEVQDYIKYRPLDMIMLRPQPGLPTVATVRNYLKAAGLNIPLLTLLTEHDPALWLAQLRAGADNVCLLDTPDHLRLAFKKELEQHRARVQRDSFEIRLQETEARSRALLDSSHDAIAYIHEGAHIYSNPVYRSLFGYPDEDVLAGMTLIDMIARDDQIKLKRALRDSMKKNQPSAPVSLTGLHSDGHTFPIEMECVPTRINDEPCLQIMIRAPAPAPVPVVSAAPAPQQNSPELVQRNQALETQVKALEKTLRDYSNLDDLTRLYNRKYFTDLLNDVCRKNQGKAGAVYYILLTDYRALGESGGLEGIDMLLTDLAKVLKNALGKHEVIAHFSDAVFTVYTPLTDNEPVLALGEKLSALIKDHAISGSKKLLTTRSAIGICQIKEYHKSATQILAQADRACDEARQKGPNQVVLYRTEISGGKGQSGDDAKMELLLDALSSKRLRALYQPIASFQNGAEKRYKSYVEVLDAQKKPLKLSEIGSIAEGHGVMNQIDRWLLATVLETLKQSGQQPLPTLFVRISNNSLTNRDFVPWLAKLLRHVSLPAHLLVLEVKEDSAEVYFNESKLLRDMLKKLGVGFALSHFGGKDNSERILKHLLPDYIKVDIDLIERLSRDAQSREIMLALADLSKENNIHLVAADISSAPQMANIWQYGVTLVQGDMVQEPSEKMAFDFQDFVG